LYDLNLASRPFRGAEEKDRTEVNEMSLKAVGDEELLDYVIEKDFEDTVSRIILGAAGMFPEGVGRVRLSNVLRGKDPGYIITDHQELAGYYGRLRLLDPDQLLDFIESLIRLSMIEVREPEFPRLIVTGKGSKALGSSRIVPAQIPWPLPSKEIPLPLDKDKYERLRKERNRMAREEELPPYCVASNLSLVEMVNREISELEDLTGVPGIGKERAERFGRMFLDVLNAA
jgi:ATP-dependent DNA helicase RecQ